MLKKYLSYLGIFILALFSFYYTDKIAMYVQNNTPLKKEIIVFKDKNIVPSINAEIKSDGIIPGINGLIVNVNKSYNNMKSDNVFSEYKLVYDEVKPEISVVGNIEKPIIKGNKNKNAISIIIDIDSKMGGLLDEYELKFDYINKTNFCVLINNNCDNDKRMKVKPSFVLNNSNFIKFVGSIDKGDIIYISDNLEDIYIDILSKHVKYYNLKSLGLNEHLSENNHL